MNRILSTLMLTLIVARAVNAGESENSSATDYNLSMAGALINDRCERDWQKSTYISIHACNYQLAHLYNLDISTVHFDECGAVSGGDIVAIADCMVERFNSWLIQEQLEGIGVELQ